MVDRHVSTMRLAVALALVACWVGRAPAIERVAFQRDGRQHEVSGRLLVTAQDGGLLVLARDGILWAIPPEEQREQSRDEAPFRPFSREEMRRQLLAELPAGFDVHETSHYLIFFDTSKAYAAWCGSLFERLYMAFHNYWTRKGFELRASEFPLVAVVFADRRAYLEYSRPELGAAGESIIGYFSLRSNRMAMYDLTGTAVGEQFTGRIAAAAQINRILAQPEATRTVATVVHEATHQIAFNCGLHQRYSDCPNWVSEGIATYFETPDLSSAKGWRGIGEINRPRLLQFRQYLRTRPDDALKTLIADDKRFHSTQTMLDAYAEAWALSYFLIRQQPRQYVAYLKVLAEKGPLLEDGPQGRLAEFERAFGKLQPLDEEFTRYMMRVR